MSRADRFYLSITILLGVAMAVGGVLLGTKQHKSPPAEIVLSQAVPCQQSGEVYVGGAVANPGLYFLKEGDTIQALLSDAGIAADADLHHIEIHLPQEGETQAPQKIDINRAELWLLEALPGIGAVRAQAIVDYRNENGAFKRIEDLLKVEGIGQETLSQIRDYIAVSA